MNKLISSNYLTKFFIILLVLVLQPKTTKSLINRVPSYSINLIKEKKALRKYVTKNSGLEILPKSQQSVIEFLRNKDISSFKVSKGLLDNTFTAPSIYIGLYPAIIDQSSNLVIARQHEKLRHCQELFKNQEFKVANCN